MFSFKLHVLPYIAFVLHRLLSWTWRVKVVTHPKLLEDMANGVPAILAHWHKDETTLVIDIRRVNAGILNSKSRDGQMMAKIVRLYGARTAKGSSSRDGVEALKGLIRLAKEGNNPAIAVDGPRGPYKEIKPGVFQLSRLAGARIYPAAVHFSKAWHFPKSWDKTYLPKPFSRVLIHWGEPMAKVDKKDDPKSSQLAKDLVQLFDKSEAESLKIFTDS